MVQSHDIAKDSTCDILKNANGRLDITECDGIPRPDALARISTGDWGIKLEAVADSVLISPGKPRFHSESYPKSEKYALSRRTPREQSEIIFLREDDKVYFTAAKSRLSLEFGLEEIQVTSSAFAEANSSARTELAEPWASECKALPAEAPHQEQKPTEEDDVVVSRSFVRDGVTPSRSTPNASVARSEVVKETPASRPKFFQVSDLSDSVEPRREGEQNGDISTCAEPFTSLGDHVRPSNESTDPKEGLLANNSVSNPLQDSGDEVEEFSAAPVGKSQQNPSERADCPEMSGPQMPHPSAGSMEKSQRLGDIQGTPTAKYFLDTPSDSSPRLGSPDPYGDVGDDADEATTEDEEGDKTPRPQAPVRRVLDRVCIPKPKPRQSSKRAISEAPDETSDIPPKKRARKSNKNSQDSHLSDIVIDGQFEQSKSKLRVQRRPLSGIIETPSPDVAQGPQQSVTDDDLYKGPAPKVVFSNSAVSDKSQLMKFLRKHGGSVTERVEEGVANVLCVGKKDLKKTGKLLLSVALGLRIVTDDWILASSKAERLLKTDNFIPEIPGREKEWGFSMADIVGKPQRDLFAGKTLYFTPALKKDYQSGFKEIEHIAKTVGVKKVVSKAARDLKFDEDCIILALEQGDLDAVMLHERQWACYHKDLLSTSILRGRLDLDSDEFVIEPTNTPPKKTKKRSS